MSSGRSAGRRRPTRTSRTARRPPNLVVRPGDGGGRGAIEGTVRWRSPRRRRPRRGRTVVLCAGTYGSPSILMRSGIGPAGHLRSVGVAVRVDLPGVGTNLADHPAIDLDLGCAGPARDAGAALRATFHSGARRADEAPDLMLWLADPAPRAAPQLTIGIVLLKPHARGSVRLRSADPADPPHRAPPSSATPSTSTGSPRATAAPGSRDPAGAAEPVRPAGVTRHRRRRRSPRPRPGERLLRATHGRDLLDGARWTPRDGFTARRPERDRRLDHPGAAVGLPAVIAIMIAERLAELIVRG